MKPVDSSDSPTVDLSSLVVSSSPLERIYIPRIEEQLQVSNRTVETGGVGLRSCNPIYLYHDA